MVQSVAHNDEADAPNIYRVAIGDSRTFQLLLIKGIEQKGRRLLYGTYFCQEVFLCPPVRISVVIVKIFIEARKLRGILPGEAEGPVTKDALSVNDMLNKLLDGPFAGGITVIPLLFRDPG